MRQAVPAIETAADLAHQVLLELETVVNGRPWYDWPQWLDAMKVRNLKPAGMLRFSHYDQVVATALSGGGLAIGKWPHLASHLQQNALVAPLGDAGVVRLGSFYFIVGSGAPSGPVEAFRAWLRAEADSDIKKRGRHASGRRAPSRTAGGEPAPRLVRSSTSTKAMRPLR
jgi:DNA-binding transcriptional LysR family regulator